METLSEVRFETSKDSSDHRTYLLRIPIAQSHFWDAGHGFHFYGRDTAPHSTAVLVSKIRGVQGFYLHDGYELKVQKAGAWEWDEIHPELVGVIAAHNETADYPTYDNPKIVVENSEASETKDNDYDYPDYEGDRP